jgi:hypothetical protein
MRRGEVRLWWVLSKAYVENCMETFFATLSKKERWTLDPESNAKKISSSFELLGGRSGYTVLGSNFVGVHAWSSCVSETAGEEVCMGKPI